MVQKMDGQGGKTTRLIILCAFKNLLCESAILRIWNKYKNGLCLNIALFNSARETFYRREAAYRGCHINKSYQLISHIMTY